MHKEHKDALKFLNKRLRGGHNTIHINYNYDYNKWQLRFTSYAPSDHPDLHQELNVIRLTGGVMGIFDTGLAFTTWEKRYLKREGNKYIFLFNLEDLRTNITDRDFEDVDFFNFS